MHGSEIAQTFWPYQVPLPCYSLQDALVVGAATPIAELADALGELGRCDRETGTGSQGCLEGLAHPFSALSAMLKRVAGAHVRNTATVGGNLVLARSGIFPSYGRGLAGIDGAGRKLLHTQKPWPVMVWHTGVQCNALNGVRHLHAVARAAAHSSDGRLSSLLRSSVLFIRKDAAGFQLTVLPRCTRLSHAVPRCAMLCCAAQVPQAGV
jgi:hypothetical protein